MGGNTLAGIAGNQRDPDGEIDRLAEELKEKRLESETLHQQVESLRHEQEMRRRQNEELRMQMMQLQVERSAITQQRSSLERTLEWEYDEIEDPLPFDLEAPVVDIDDRDYALFYSDLSEGFRKYEGKTLHYKGLVVKSARLADDCFIFGRQLMTCCANDIQFTGLAAIWPEAKTLAKGEWAEVTAKVVIKWHKAYGKKGPVLMVTYCVPCEPPAEPVATFY